MFMHKEYYNWQPLKTSCYPEVTQFIKHIITQGNGLSKSFVEGSDYGVVVVFVDTGTSNDVKS